MPSRPPTGSNKRLTAKQSSAHIERHVMCGFRCVLFRLAAPASWHEMNPIQDQEALWGAFLVLLVMSLLISSTLTISSGTVVAEFVRTSGMENCYYTVIVDSGTDTYPFLCGASFAPRS